MAGMAARSPRLRSGKATEAQPMESRFSRSTTKRPGMENPKYPTDAQGGYRAKTQDAVSGKKYPLTTANKRFYGKMPIWLDDCKAFFLDLGASKGKSIKKLFEPRRYLGGSKLILIHLDQYRHSKNLERKEFFTNHLCTLGFDPNPRLFRKLRQMERNYTSKGYKVKIFPFAATDKNDKVTLYTQGENSIHKDWGASLLKSQNTDVKYMKHIVKGIRLVEFIQQILESKPIPLMKMDIEGSEYNLILDLLNAGLLCQKYIQTILMEFHDPPYYDLRFDGHNTSFEIKRRIQSQNSCQPTIIKQFDDDGGLKEALPPQHGKTDTSYPGMEGRKDRIEGKMQYGEGRMKEGGVRIGESRMEGRRNRTSGGMQYRSDRRKEGGMRTGEGRMNLEGGRESRIERKRNRTAGGMQWGSERKREGGMKTSDGRMQLEGQESRIEGRRNRTAGEAQWGSNRRNEGGMRTGDERMKLEETREGGMEGRRNITAGGAQWGNVGRRQREEGRVSRTYGRIQGRDGEMQREGGMINRNEGRRNITEGGMKAQGRNPFGRNEGRLQSGERRIGTERMNRNGGRMQNGEGRLQMSDGRMQRREGEIGRNEGRLQSEEGQMKGFMGRDRERMGERQGQRMSLERKKEGIDRNEGAMKRIGRISKMSEK